MMYRFEYRTGTICATAGSLMVLVGTYLHPMAANPNDPVAAFTEYAAHGSWVASHMVQLAGVALIVAALLLLAHSMETGSRRGWSQIAAGGASASLASAAVLQAVDGIALKNTVDAWATAPAMQKDVAFQAALAVRQIEIGLASTGSLLFGLTVLAYGVALLADCTYPRWFAAMAIVGGLCTAVAGVVMAYEGFSEWAMAISMPVNSVLLAWTFILGVLMWRRSRAAPGTFERS